jgi:phosphonoacetaldehyde hydrolase
MSIKSEFCFRREYHGGVKTLVLDWSGTMADAYVIAPAVVFAEVFEKQGVSITMKEARGPMGLRKDLHIKALAEDPQIRERWMSVHGKYPDQGDVDRMFEDFVPSQLACLPAHTGLLPGVADVVGRLRQQGIKVGCSTGFTRPMVDVLEKAAKEQGLELDASVAGDEVTHGARPRPFMVYRNLDLMDAWPIQSVIKVDDTVSGVGEGLNAGCWAVGVSRYSNYMNINSLQEADDLPIEEMDRRNNETREILRKAGAHYVLDSIAEIELVIEDINQRLARGERP